eukprot:2858803-Pyramimonas_sp.AAC.1
MITGLLPLPPSQTSEFDADGRFQAEVMNQFASPALVLLEKVLQMDDDNWEKKVKTRLSDAFQGLDDTMSNAEAEIVDIFSMAMDLGSRGASVKDDGGAKVTRSPNMACDKGCDTRLLDLHTWQTGRRVTKVLVAKMENGPNTACFKGCDSHFLGLQTKARLKKHGLTKYLSVASPCFL